MNKNQESSQAQRITCPLCDNANVAEYIVLFETLTDLLIFMFGSFVFAYPMTFVQYVLSNGAFPFWGIAFEAMIVSSLLMHMFISKWIAYRHINLRIKEIRFLVCLYCLTNFRLVSRHDGSTKIIPGWFGKILDNKHNEED